SYRGELRIPAVARERYSALQEKWRATKPLWSCDEDALCRWIAKHEPKFFEKEIPLLGYLQFRIEDYSGDRDLTIRKLVVDTSWAVSGLHSIPSNNVKPDYSKKWWFQADGGGK